MTGGSLFLVRHGRTAWNRTRFLGRADVELDAVGRQQAAEAAAALRDRPIAAVWSSPLRRAHATALSIAAVHGVTVRTTELLLELDCGDWEGRSKRDVPVTISRRDPCDPLPGGESVADGFRRAGQLVDEITAELMPGRHLVLVGHYLLNQLVLAALTSTALEQALHTSYRPAPGSVTELPYEIAGGSVVVPSSTWRMSAPVATADARP
jgi:broad specificity phosphatase PhoE